MNSSASRFLTIMAITITTLATSACGHPRVFVGTGTLVGLEATPGNPDEGQTPAVTFGYRRAEIALVPIEKDDNEKVGVQGTGNEPKVKKDAASTLATFNLAHNWFGPARIEQYVATGFSARTILTSTPYALALIGYEKGADELADQLALSYESAHKDKAKENEKACWESVKTWMTNNFPGLPPSDILIKGFRKQRPKLCEDNEVKNACKLPAPPCPKQSPAS